jgi:hypothetical protein
LPDGDRHVLAADGTRRLEILRREDSHFRFIEETRVAGEPPHEPEYYWLPTYESGLYATADGAEREACAVLGWFAELT